ncbi:dihydropteroate synthase [Pedobacter sp. SYSU D00535]|uniref:dihydropteroate synthase n=1 Tax=Pedobacter sp. SYSU D00535 TaxID=2810308 RepID=UPI001A96A89A|nr:dihydropteroate synthase [Pedobacter sp. SYSU D00535]
MTDKNTLFNVKRTINFRGRLLDLGTPRVMGILNITPDSFYAGSRVSSVEQGLKTAEQMLQDGATFIDIGAYSSRPGAADITEEEELERLLPVVKAIVKEFPESILSIDTFRSAVARAAILEGAHMVNDISGGELDAKMFETVAELHVPYILMHMKGTPRTMKNLCQYDDLIKEILIYFGEKLNRLKELGVTDVIADPGFGFAKTIDQNFELLNQFHSLKILGIPILAGLSRKSMIWKTLNIQSDEALNGTTVLNTVALQKGASILRVHDVREAVQTIRLFQALNDRG